jgi:uncharacterized protein (DUF2141 family)
MSTNLFPALPRAAQALALGAALLAVGSAQAFDLTVEVLNAKSAQGTVSGAIFGSEADWLKDGQASQGAREPAAARTVLVYRNLPAGRYAVSVFHDENGNGKLDTNPAGIPIERYGFSRDARGMMGPPAFADAAVDLQADTTLTVNLR